MYNVLVTGVGGDIGQSVIKCLKEFPSYYRSLVGCDVNEFAGGRAMVDLFNKSPHASHEEKYSIFINEILQKRDIGHIFPTSEAEIQYFHRNRKKFPNQKIYINKPEIIETFFDKYSTIKFLKENGFDYPETYLPSEYRDSLDFPLIIKKRRTYGGRGLVIINNAQEYKYYCEGLSDDMIIQEYVGNLDQEYTIAVFSSGKEIHSMIFRRYLQQGHGGFSSFVELVQDSAIEKLAERFARTTGLIGSINIQLRKHKDRNVIFEVNPRISSTVFFRHYFGFQDVKWWMDIKKHREFIFEKKYSKGIGVKTYGEVFFNLE